MRYSRTGQLLLTASVDHTLCLWDLDTGALRRQYHLHAGPVLDIDWCPVWAASAAGRRDQSVPQATDPDNQFRFASCSTDGNIFVIDIRDENNNDEAVAAAAVTAATNAAAIPTAAAAAVASAAAAVAPPVGRYAPRCLSGHEGEVNSVSWDPTGTLLLSCSDDRSAKIWNGLSGEIVHELLGHDKEVLTAKWSMTGPCTDFHKQPLFVATGSTDTTIKLFDPASGHCLHTLTHHTHPITHVAFAPRLQLLATASHERVFVWSLSTGMLLKTFRNLGDPLQQTPLHVPLGTVGGLNDLAFDSKGEQIALAYADGMTYVADLHEATTANHK
jgi:transducin (beta)-like 1